MRCLASASCMVSLGKLVRRASLFTQSGSGTRGERPRDGSSAEGNWISSLKIHEVKPVYTS